MKILKIEPLQPPVSCDIDGSLSSMQSLVGGTIQILYPFTEDPDIALVCNDEGKLLHLLPNRSLKDENGQIYDIVCGTFFLCGAPADSDRLTDLPQEKIDESARKFYYAELFFGL